MQVELQDASGSAIEGFSLLDSQELYGDRIAQTIGWRGQPDLGALAGETVRLRFALRDADLFAFRFRPAP